MRPRNPIILNPPFALLLALPLATADPTFTFTLPNGVSSKNTPDSAIVTIKKTGATEPHALSNCANEMIGSPNVHNVISSSLLETNEYIIINTGPHWCSSNGNSDGLTADYGAHHLDVPADCTRSGSDKYTWTCEFPLDSSPPQPTRTFQEQATAPPSAKLRRKDMGNIL
ncbi:hypothetical protein ABVK25_002397 [Lepraria finkii]|uniref:Uncharacterized protein n=1 Tax=Lepraria finkii TaxID=1340010 RepID=A0ABR4BHQ3_9LECA